VPFSEYLGNERIVATLRGALRNDRVPHAMLFCGPRGVGKYALARMFAQAANCERFLDDFCGACETCRKIGQLANPCPLIEQGLTQRGESADAATVERLPLILQTHPDVWAIVPDPVRLRNPVSRPVIRMGQLRAVQRAAYFKPFGKRRVFILDGAETMRWDFSNVCLKILEEPPESATLILLAPSPYQLLPTIVSRCLQFFFAPLQAEPLEKILAAHTGMKPAERRLAAQLAEGCPGVAMGLDLEATAQLRRDALNILSQAVDAKSYAALFRGTASLVKSRQESFEVQLEVFYSLLTDLLELSCGSGNPALRNPALRKELEAVSRQIDFHWLRRAVQGLDELYGRARRNVNRQLGLDAVAVSLGSER
jgi:DNA polymerase-3 subunit delta'